MKGRTLIFLLLSPLYITGMTTLTHIMFMFIESQITCVYLDIHVTCVFIDTASSIHCSYFSAGCIDRILFRKKNTIE